MFRREALAYRSDNWPVYTGVVGERPDSLSVSMPTNFGNAINSSAHAMNLVWGGSSVAVLSSGHMSLTTTGGAGLSHAGLTGMTTSAWGGTTSLTVGGYLPVGLGLSESGVASFTAGGTLTFSSVSGSSALPQTAAQGRELFDLLARWLEEDASIPDPDFDRDYADLQSSPVKFNSSR